MSSINTSMENMEKKNSYETPQFRMVRLDIEQGLLRASKVKSTDFGIDYGGYDEEGEESAD